MRWLYAILTCLLLRFFYYWYHYLRSNKYLVEYKRYITEQESNYILTHKQTIERTVRAAGIKDALLGNAQPVGYGYIQTGRISVMRNLSNLREDVVFTALAMLEEAPGALRQKMIDTFNPFYWIEFIVYLPRHILAFLGAEPQGVVVKVFQLLWWTISAAGVIIGIIFNGQFMDWLKHMAH